MKSALILTLLLFLSLLAGCANAPETSENHVRLGLSREQLRSRFGDPVRIESRGANGEDWIYKFVSWDTQPSATSDTSNDFGQRTVSGGVGINFTRTAEELPIHLSPDGHVIAPLPVGKVVIN